MALHTRSPAFGGDCNFSGHVQVGFCIHEKIADSLVVLDDGNAAVLGNEANQAFASPGIMQWTYWSRVSK